MNLLKLKNIKAIRKHFVKQGSKWVQVECTENFVTGQFYQNVIEAKRFFQNLGGYERHEKNYTEYGYIVTHVNSISPNRAEKSTFDFYFDKATWEN